MKARRVVLCLGAALTVSCSPADLGPTDAGSSGDGGGPLGLAQAAADRAYAFCGRLEYCSPTAVLLRFGTLQTCQELYAALYVGEAQQPQSGVTVAALEACTAAIGTMSTSGWNCEDIINNAGPPPECSGFSGSRPMGASCSVGAQCQSSFCALPYGSDCGTCAPVPQPTDSCAAHQCTYGLVCNSSQICVAYAPIGTQCNSGSQPCGAGLTCVGATTTTAGVCTPAVQAINTACSFTLAGCDIYSGLACNASNNTCLTAHIGSAGEACGTVGDQTATCSVGACIRGACRANVPWGGPCNLDGGAPCIDSTRCVLDDGGVSGTCQVSGAVACP